MSLPYRLTLNEGAFLVKLARKTVESKLKNLPKPTVNEEELTPAMKAKMGVFTTINKYLGANVKELRGCIGYPYPIKPLYRAVMETAIEAAFRDPRFEPLSAHELDEVVFEISILSPLERITFKSPKELYSAVRIGRDGLLLKYGPFSGLLLPQVPVEYRWTVEEYLINLSMKAGLPPDGYLYKGAEIYRFEAQIFTEVSPNGPVVEEFLTKG